MQIRKAASFLLFIFLSQNIYAEPILSIGQDLTSHLAAKNVKFNSLISHKNVSILSKEDISEEFLGQVSESAHNTFKRCGGYMWHSSVEEALESIETSEKAVNALPDKEYTIDQQATVEEYLKYVDAKNIEATIRKLSSFKNRYYQSNTGVEASNWIFNHWKELTKNRNDVKIEQFNHSSWPQKSVILTIEGETSPDEYVILGGHLDSISGFWSPRESAAPGADDNASGISTITEVLRVLTEQDFKPQKSIRFMGYAAEEVGLYGSKEIAAQYQSQNVNVYGVMQLDMTNFKGSSKHLYLISDYTNIAQNEFVGKLIDAYVNLDWGYSRCGYACSDHASWTGKGFKASFPFEAESGDMNKKIHTAGDTIDVSGGNASHAVKFAKLALSYLVEMSK